MGSDNLKWNLYTCERGEDLDSVECECDRSSVERKIMQEIGRDDVGGEIAGSASARSVDHPNRGSLTRIRRGDFRLQY